jgi:hypothetical protein
MLTAVASELAVVTVDHRQARAHKARDRKHRDAGAQREAGVGGTQVVEMAERLVGPRRPYTEARPAWARRLRESSSYSHESPVR